MSRFKSLGRIVNSAGFIEIPNLRKDDPVMCTNVLYSGNFHMVQNFVVFTDRLAAAKIRIMKTSM